MVPHTTQFEAVLSTSPGKVISVTIAAARGGLNSLSMMLSSPLLRLETCLPVLTTRKNSDSPLIFISEKHESHKCGVSLLPSSPALLENVGPDSEPFSIWAGCHYRPLITTAPLCILTFLLFPLLNSPHIL